jgi:dihydrofolate reductase
LKEAGSSKQVLDFIERQKESVLELKLSWSKNPTMVMTYDNRTGWLVPLTPEWEKKANNTQFQAGFLVGVDDWDSIEVRFGYMVARDNTVTDGRPYYLASYQTLQRKNKVMEHGVATPQEAWDALDAYFKAKAEREDKARRDAVLWLKANPEAEAEIRALGKLLLKKIGRITDAHGGLPEGVRPKHIRIALRK